MWKVEWLPWSLEQIPTICVERMARRPTVVHYVVDKFKHLVPFRSLQKLQIIVSSRESHLRVLLEPALVCPMLVMSLLKIASSR